jgi:hypothetical protein
MEPIDKSTQKTSTLAEAMTRSGHSKELSESGSSEFSALSFGGLECRGLEPAETLYPGGFL